MSDNLKPCPFCGGQAAFQTVLYPENSDTARLNGQRKFYGVNCISCGASTLGLIGSKSFDEALEKWNRRIK